MQGWRVGVKASLQFALPLGLVLLWEEAGIEPGLEERRKVSGWGEGEVLWAQD